MNNIHKILFSVNEFPNSLSSSELLHKQHHQGSILEMQVFTLLNSLLIKILFFMIIIFQRHLDHAGDRSQPAAE